MVVNNSENILIMKTKSKTGIEWLSYLPKDVQVEWCRNYVNNPLSGPKMKRTTIAEFLNETHVSLFEFINWAFLWQETPEGHEYWENWAMHTKYKTK
jgi:hypothetical protein